MTRQPHHLEPAAAPVGKGSAIWIAAIAALGGLLFSYDTGVISGAELFFTKDFHLSADGEELTVSGVLIGTIVGAARHWVAAPPAEKPAEPTGVAGR
jgi:hypothetical protein